MEFNKLIKENTIELNIIAKDKEAIINEMIELLSKDGVIKEGVDYGSIDGNPVNIIFMIAVNDSQNDRYIMDTIQWLVKLK